MMSPTVKRLPAINSLPSSRPSSHLRLSCTVAFMPAAPSGMSRIRSLKICAPSVKRNPLLKKFRILKPAPPLPLARLGALLGRGADQRRGRMLFFEVLPDGNRFAETVAVIQLERRQLPARISVGIWGTAIFRFHQI